MRERILTGRTLVSREKFRTKSLLKVHRNLWKEAKKTEEGKLETSRTWRAFKYGYLFILFWALLKKLYAFLKKNRVLQAFVVETLKARHKVCTCAGVWPNAVCRSYPLLDFIEEENHLVGKNTNILNHLLGSSSGGIVFNCPYQFACRDPWK